MRISVFGPGSCKFGDEIYSTGTSIGRLLAEADAITVTGGYSGVHEAAAKGAIEVGGSTIGIHLGELSPEQLNRYISKGVDCSYFNGPLSIVTAYNLRRGRLLESDGLIFVGGGFGTIDLFLGGLNLNSKFWIKEGGKRIALLDVEGQISWQRMLNTLQDLGLPIEDVCPFLLITKDAREAVDWVLGR